MEEAAARAALVQSLRDRTFGNSDILNIIRSNVGCDSITDFCLASRMWCDKVIDGGEGANELRINVAKCLITRINDKLIALRDVMRNNGHIGPGWENNPESPLFIELGDKFVGASIQLELEDGPTAANFLTQNPTFKSNIEEIAKFLAVLFNVQVHETILNTDEDDLQYSRINVGFDQTIPINVREELPFTSTIDGHIDGYLRLSPVDDTVVSDETFKRLLEWRHLRRSRRLRQ